MGPQYDCSGTDDVMLCPEWIEGMVEDEIRRLVEE
jgi:hypothetical protein